MLSCSLVCKYQLRPEQTESKSALYHKSFDTVFLRDIYSENVIELWDSYQTVFGSGPVADYGVPLLSLLFMHIPKFGQKCSFFLVYESFKILTLKIIEIFS